VYVVFSPDSTLLTGTQLSDLQQRVNSLVQSANSETLRPLVSQNAIFAAPREADDSVDDQYDSALLNSLFLLAEARFVDSAERLCVSNAANNSQCRPQPAAQSAIDALPRTVGTNSQSTKDIECAVCKNDLQPDELLIELPCSHLYHEKCLLPWLQQHHHTCPMCRYKLVRADEEGNGDIKQSATTRTFEDRLADIPRGGGRTKRKRERKRSVTAKTLPSKRTKRE